MRAPGRGCSLEVYGVDGEGTGDSLEVYVEVYGKRVWCVYDG